MTLPAEVAAFAMQLAERHAWHATMQQRPMHPVIVELLTSRPLPQAWQAVILEWPHNSDENSTLLAYTPNEEKALKGIVVNLAPTKYVRKFWADLADHQVRDVVVRVANAANFRWFTTSDEIVRGVQEGPRSCMQKSWFDTPSTPHPYRAYAPELGWRMAIRLGPEGRIDGRALVHQCGTESVFVRSYSRTFERDYGNNMVEVYSQSDTALEAWLCNQGIDKVDGWDDGTMLARAETEIGTPMVPYLDGDNDRFTFVDAGLRIEEGGKHCADCQDGTYSTGGNWRTCWSCGEDFDADADDYIFAGANASRCIGECCLDDYTEARGHQGRVYHVEDTNVTRVDGEAYDMDYLSDNGIVELHDGDYAKEADSVHSNWDDEYYRRDEVVETEDMGWVPREETWQCAATGNWYSNDIKFVEVEDEKYHPDDAPSGEEEEDDESPFDTPSTLLDVYAVGAEQTPAVV